MELHSLRPHRCCLPPGNASATEMDRHGWLRRNSTHWLTLLFSFPLPITPSALKLPKTYIPTIIWPDWESNMKLKCCFPTFFRTFAWSNESMSRMFESLGASLSPDPLCTQYLKCNIHALMRDKMEIKNHCRAIFCAWQTDQFVLFLQQHNNLIHLRYYIAHTEHYFGW